MASLLSTQEFSVNITVLDDQPGISPWFVSIATKRSGTAGAEPILSPYGALLPKIAAP